MAMTLHSPRRRPASVPLAALLASSLLAAAAVAAPVAAPSPAAPATTASRSVTEAARPGKEGSNAAQLQRWIEQSAPMTWSGGGDSLLDQSTDPPSAAPHPTRVKVSVGRLDDNPRLAPCARMEPFLPPNTRLWGRTHVGVRCIEGTLIRMGIKLNVNGASQFPEPGNPSISIRGGTLPGSGLIGYYQTYYRNAANYCTPATFNISSAVSIGRRAMSSGSGAA